MKKNPESKEKSDNKSNNSNWKGNKKKGSANMVTGTTTDNPAEPETTPTVNSVNRHKPTPQTMM